MIPSRDSLADKAGHIIGNLTQFSEELHIGFGSFIDKELQPMISRNPSFDCNDDTCRQPYREIHEIMITYKAPSSASLISRYILRLGQAA